MWCPLPRLVLYLVPGTHLGCDAPERIGILAVLQVGFARDDSNAHLYDVVRFRGRRGSALDLHSRPGAVPAGVPANVALSTAADGPQPLAFWWTTQVAAMSGRRMTLRRYLFFTSGGW